MATEPCRSREGIEGTELRSARRWGGTQHWHKVQPRSCLHTALRGDNGCRLSSLGSSHPAVLWGALLGWGDQRDPEGPILSHTAGL